MKQRAGYSLILSLFIVCCEQLADAQPLDVIAVQGGPVPGRTESFLGFGGAAINTAGQTAFVGLVGGGDDAVFLRDSSGQTFVELARQGDVAPGNNGQFGSGLTFGRLFLNDAGQVAFQAGLVNTSGGPGVDTSGFYLSDGTPNAPVEVIRAGNATPNGVGRFSGLGPSGFNHSGQVVMSPFIDLQDGGATSDEFSVYRFDGVPGSLTRIARTGDPSPDGSDTFGRINNNNVVMNGDGQVAFFSELVSAETAAVFLSNGPGDPVELARDGNPAPRGPGDLYIDGPCTLEKQGCTIGQPSQLNDDATFVSVAFYDVDPDPFPLRIYEEAGILRIDGAGAPMETLVRSGDPVPGGGIFFDFGRPQLNNSGDIVFTARLTETSGTGDDSGIFMIQGDTVVELLREGDVVPNGNGKFEDFYEPLDNISTRVPIVVDLNDAGQFVFRSRMTETDNGFTDDEGLFFYDPATGFREIIRGGDPLLDGTIDPNSFSVIGQLNDSGQVLVRFTLAFQTGVGQRRGLAVWPASIPEPATGTLLITCGLALLACRRARRGE